MSNQLTVSSSPHIRSKDTTSRIMLDVIIALLPAVVAGVIIFGWRARLVLSVTTASAVLSEFLFNLAVKKEQTVADLSAVVTGLLLGLNVTYAAPIWQCVLGSVFAIVVVKCFFGGIGCNFANPAITGRIFMMICFTSTIGGFVSRTKNELGETVFVSQETPLAVINEADELPSLLDMFLGNYGGTIGETCTLALVIGFVYLVARRVIKFETPLVFVGTVFVLSLIVDSSFTVALYHVLSGGLVIGAVFMATDYVTTPVNRCGKMVFAVGCGLITYLIRVFGNYAEGVSFAILFMNILSPYIEKWTASRPLGGASK